MQQTRTSKLPTTLFRDAMPYYPPITFEPWNYVDVVAHVASTAVHGVTRGTGEPTASIDIVIHRRPGHRGAACPVVVFGVGRRIVDILASVTRGQLLRVRGRLELDCRNGRSFEGKILIHARAIWLAPQDSVASPAVRTDLTTEDH